LLPLTVLFGKLIKMKMLLLDSSVHTLRKSIHLTSSRNTKMIKVKSNLITMQLAVMTKQSEFGV
jgi:hypothetical protein